MFTAAALAAAFDLVCNGNMIVVGPKPTDRSAPVFFSRTYRVNLDALRWCSGKCEKSEVLDAVYPTLIVFNNPTDADRAKGVYVETYVNRESGAFVDKLVVDDTSFVSNATCERAPFSGLPTVKF